MPFEWAKSAEKHYPIADGLHAVRNRVFMLPRFDIDRETGEDVHLVVGSARDGQTLEVYLHLRPPNVKHLFHVLHFRPSTKTRAQAIITDRQKKEGTP